MTPLSKQPAYAAAVAEHNTLAAVLGKVESRIAEIELILLTDADVPADRDAAHVEAAKHFSETGIVKGLSTDPTMLRDEHLLLREQRDATKKAMNAQFNVLQDIEREMSNAIARENDAKHRAIAARWVALMNEADAVLEEEAQLLASLRKGGYDPHFRNLIASPALGRINDKNSHLSHHVATVARYAR